MSIPVIPQTDNKDIECQFVVKSKQVAYFKIRWLGFGIQLFEHGCDENNYIEIYDGFYNRKDKLLTKKCDRKLNEIRTRYNEMLIRFKIQKFKPVKNFEFMYIGGKSRPIISIFMVLLSIYCNVNIAISI